MKTAAAVTTGRISFDDWMRKYGYKYHVEYRVHRGAYVAPIYNHDSEARAELFNLSDYVVSSSLSAGALYLVERTR